MRRSALIVLAGSLAILVGVTPGAASPARATSPASWGSVGLCKMRTVAAGQAELVKLVVTPPDELSEPSVAGKVYGWRFIVKREKGSTQRTVVTYRSSIQRDRANSAGNFDFTRMRVPVEVPDSTSTSWAYRVFVRVYAYRSDGSIKWTAKAAVYDYRVYVDGSFAYEESAWCWGRASQS